MPAPLCIKCIRIFKGLEKEEEREITSLLEKETYSKGDTIFTPYEDYKNIFMIHKGQVELYQISADGKKIIIDVLKSGDLFLNFSLFSDSTIKVTDFAETTEDSEIYKMSRNNFLNTILKYSKVALNIIKELSKKLNEADGRIRDLALNNATVRSINELLRLSKRYGTDTKNGTKIDIRLTHEDFAELIGTSRETASKVLKKLHNLSFIDYSKDKHIILNTNKIKEPI